MNASHLLNPLPPWLARYTSDDETLDRTLLALRADAEIGRLVVVALRGRKMRERQGMFDEFAAALQFPYYFGENWNALNDCITDLQWLPAEGFVVVIEHTSEALVAADSDEFGLLLERLGQAAESWSKPEFYRSAKPFHVLLHDVPEQAGRLDSRLRGLGLRVPAFEANLPRHP